MHRRTVVRTDAFRDSLSAIGDGPEILWLLESLIARVERWPELGPLVAETKAVRMVRSRSTDGLPSIRIFYSVGRDCIWLLKATRYDELWFPRGSS